MSITDNIMDGVSRILYEPPERLVAPNSSYFAHIPSPLLPSARLLRRDSYIYCNDVESSSCSKQKYSVLMDMA